MEILYFKYKLVSFSQLNGVIGQCWHMSLSNGTSLIRNNNWRLSWLSYLTYVNILHPRNSIFSLSSLWRKNYINQNSFDSSRHLPIFWKNILAIYWLRSKTGDAPPGIYVHASRQIVSATYLSKLLTRLLLTRAQKNTHLQNSGNNYSQRHVNFCQL